MRKVAIIELGTLKVKMVIAEVQNNETYIVLDQISDSLKIASDLYEDWLIKPARTQELVAILKNYRAYCQAQDVEDFECVASFEYLDAKNHSSFIEELYSQSGFKFKVLEKDEQIMNYYTSTINTLDVSKGLIVSIEGNKAQILNYNRRNLLNQMTFDFGACNLAEASYEEGLVSDKLCEKMVNKFKDEIKEATWLKELDPETQIIGVGDIFTGISKLSRKIKKYPYDKDHNYNMTIDDFEKVYDLIKTLEIDKTKKLKGVSNIRADILAAGICIAKAIVNESICQNIVINQNGIGEGVLLNVATPLTLEKPITDILGYSLERLNSYYNTYSKNTSTVYSLAMILYKQLKVLHKLPRTFIKVLRIASTFHDCGKRINAIRYEKNGFDIVMKSDICGATHREQVLAAFVVACQYTEDFNMSEFIKYKEQLFEEEDMDAVKKLGVIVRMASALDCFNKNKIQDISCDILGDSVILKTIVEVSAEMEIKEALKCELDFLK
ncbi:MAG: hypothetical protein KBT30_02640, partial [Clostridiales bacterium]|nr:hypothetical protein [Candidatus Apopatousia equi]